MEVGVREDSRRSRVAVRAASCHVGAVAGVEGVRVEFMGWLRARTRNCFLLQY